MRHLLGETLMPVPQQNAGVRLNFRISDSNRTLGQELDTPVFRRTLTTLLSKTGFPNYEGIITPLAGMKATANTIGMRVRSPSSSIPAVELVWQEGSNDSRVSFLISAPHGVDKFQFQAKLKDAAETMKEANGKEPSAEKKNTVVKLFPEKEGAKKPAPAKREIPESGEFDVMSLGVEDEPEAPHSAQSVPAALPAAAQEAPKPPAPQAKPADVSPAAMFAQSIEQVQRFMKQCLQYTNTHGELKRAHCMHVLSTGFGIAQDQVKLAFDSMLLANHLRTVSNPVYVRLDDQWLRKHFAGAATPAPVKPAAATPSSVAPQSATQAAPSGIASAIAALTAITNKEAVMRARLTEITTVLLPKVQTEREALEVQALRLEENRGRLASERNSLSQALENPEFAKAKAELASIRAMFDAKK
jgi:hypothetical protein